METVMLLWLSDVVASNALTTLSTIVWDAEGPLPSGA
jgi:hypothetical protein